MTVLFSTKELEALLEPSNYSNPRMNTTDQDSEKQKRLGRNLLPEGGGGEGQESHIKTGGMLVVSLRAVNFGFWSHLGCSGQNAIICSREGFP